MRRILLKLGNLLLRLPKCTLDPQKLGDLVGWTDGQIQLRKLVLAVLTINCPFREKDFSGMLTFVVLKGWVGVGVGNFGRLIKSIASNFLHCYPFLSRCAKSQQKNKKIGKKEERHS